MTVLVDVDKYENMDNNIHTFLGKRNGKTKVTNFAIGL